MSDVEHIKAAVIAATETMRTMPIAETTEKVRRLDSGRVAELIGEAVAILTGFKTELDEVHSVAAATLESGGPVYDAFHTAIAGSSNLNIRGAARHADQMLDRLVDQSEGTHFMGENVRDMLDMLADVRGSAARYETMRATVIQGGEQGADLQQQCVEAATRYTDNLG